MSAFKTWRAYWSFAHTVRRELRYVWRAEVQEFLDTLLQTASPRKLTLKKGRIYWRAQLGNGWREIREIKDSVPCAHPPERMHPLRDAPADGRANAKGIPCLYLATEKDTAMSEVRPWVGSYVSVAQFELKRSLKIIDCSRNHAKFPIYFEEPEQNEIAEAVWTHIDRAFAEPMTRADDTEDYIPTQIIAELFRREGFDGIAYKSKFGERGFNIALFDIDVATLLNCSLYKVDELKMKFSESDSPYFVSKKPQRRARRKVKKLATR